MTKNLQLTLLVFMTTVLAELIFVASSSAEFLVPLEKYIGLFIFLFLFSFIKNKFIRFCAMNMVLLFSFGQMMHIKFYGMPAYPTAFWLLFVESSEVFATFFSNLNIVIIPALLTIPALILNWKFNFKIQDQKSIPFIQFLFFFYLIYNPLRTFKTGNTWGRQPSTTEMMGMNLYLSASYFLGKILPFKFSNSKIRTSKLKINFEKITPFQGNIIFVIGESLSANHLSLLGYQRKTTPFLDSLKDSPNFLFKRGISSGVSTDVAVAFLMNSTFGTSGISDVLSGSKCLFKLAKNSNFTTHFYSSQSQQQLRYITNSLCPQYIDKYKNLNLIQPELKDENWADDLKLIDQFQLDKENQFIVLHKRGSHSPYAKRYPKKMEYFKIEGDYSTRRRNHYDNSVLNFDHFFKKLIQKVNSAVKLTLVFYVSDHGEALGEEGAWGHAALIRPSIEVPVLAYTNGPSNEFELFKILPENPTHLNISLYISKLLGHKPSISPEESIHGYQIFGNDMDGFAGYLDTKFVDGKLIEIIRRDI